MDFSENPYDIDEHRRETPSPRKRYKGIFRASRQGEGLALALRATE